MIYGNSLTESDAKKNRKLFIVYVKKKVIGGAIVVYVVVKIFTGLNQIRDQGQSQTLAVATRPVIERVVYNSYGSIFDEYHPSGLYISNFERPSNFYYNRYTRHIIYFDKITGDLIMGEKFRQPYFNKALINNNIRILDNNKKN